MRRVLLLLAWVLSMAACERETTPPLIEVRDVSPRLVEEGDHVVIAGVGFPEGKVAHVAFRGDLHRPGAAAVTGVEVDVETLVGSSTEVDLPVTALLVKRFVGTGDRAAHTTFSGDVTLAFAARTPAAPPVVGTLHDMWLDVRPPTPHASVADAEASEGERTLAFLGMKSDPTPVLSGGVRIDSIEPGSRAETARLLAGDVVTEFDGVRVLSMRDVASAPGDRSAWLKVRRSGSSHEEVARLSLLGWKPPLAAALFGPALVLGLAAVLLLLFFAPTPDGVAWAARQIATRLRAWVRTQDREGRSLATRLFGLRSGAPRDVTVFATGGAVSCLFASLPFTRFLGFGEVDAGILVVLSLTALSLVALGAGGARRRGPAFFAHVRRVFRVLSLGIPAVASTIGVVTMTGSLGMEDIVRAQSGWPWGWTLFRNPLAFVLFLLSFASVLLRPEAPSGERALPEADGARSLPSPLEALVTANRASPGARLFLFTECIHLLVLSLVFAALFLGGWQIPGLAAEQVQAHLGLTLVGALLYVGKTWLVVAAIIAARWAFPALGGRPEDVMSLVWRWLIPLSLGSLLVTALWSGGTAVPAIWLPGQGNEPFVSAVMLALTCAAVTHGVMRVRSFMKEGTGERVPGMDPFL